MRPLLARELLLVWEQGERQSPPERALALLAVACPERSVEELSALPVGWCEGRLFALYHETFGGTLDLIARCPECAELLELAVEVEELSPKGEEDLPPPGDLAVAEGGLALRLRLPSATDLLAAAGAVDAAAGRRLLAERAVVEAIRDAEPVGPADLQAGEIDLISRRLAQSDPRAELLLDLVCPACSHRFQAVLDAAECLWREIEGAALRLLREIHTLARGYGWREADILAMSSRRRRRYVEMLAG